MPTYPKRMVPKRQRRVSVCRRSCLLIVDYCNISLDLYSLYARKYNFPRFGETLITCSGTVGRCERYDGNPAYFQDSNIVWLRGHNSPISNYFFFNVSAITESSTLSLPAALPISMGN